MAFRAPDHAGTRSTPLHIACFENYVPEADADCKWWASRRHLRQIHALKGVETARPLHPQEPLGQQSDLKELE